MNGPGPGPGPKFPTLNRHVLNYHLTITDPLRLDMSCTSSATQTAVLALSTKCDNAHVVTYNNPTAINDDHQLLEA